MKYNGLSVLIVMGICSIGFAFICFLPAMIESNRPALTVQPAMNSIDDEIQNPADIETHDPGVHLFPAKDFPERLARWIWDHPQTVVITVCHYHDGRYLVITRPDPNRLPDVIPGQPRPNIDDDIPVPTGRR